MQPFPGDDEHRLWAAGSTGDLLALAHRLVGSGEGDGGTPMDHTSLIAAVTELTRRMLPADECWYLAPSRLTRRLISARESRGAWTRTLPAELLDGRASCGVAAAVAVPCDDDLGALLVWREVDEPWSQARMRELVDLGMFLGRELDRTAGAQLTPHQRATQQFEELRSEMMWTINHELRTPLAVIDASLELLRTTTDPDLTARLFDRIERSVGRLQRLADDVTMTGAPLRPWGRDDAVRTPLRALLAAAGDTWRRLYPARIVQIEMADDAVLGAPADRIREALDRLISNAVKFSSSGPIRVRVEPGEPPYSRSMVRISVCDDGIGIPDDEHFRVGTRFFKASNARELQVQGMGLGIAATTALARSWGGELVIRSEAGVGTVAELTVPLAPPSAQAPGSRPGR